ncbi:MAG TPA: LytTR family DNA-binding domain-containing protein [Bryobacteraceae bacterium]|nr:response regulator transcription factor [Solibacteraceae bacterium]HRJ21820.1 LytTR family DNA-binding domain-containing protein [Bryobacteraceae bacterium]
MRALLIDDERLARVELRRLLGAHPGIEIVGEAASAEEAEILIESLHPDLLFLDVQMPGRTGFELLESLDSAPRVIFVTAYDEHALKAFEVSAIDYLVKPVAPERLAGALARVAAEPVPAVAAALPASRQVFVREGERCWFVKLADVALFESEGNYTRVYFERHRPLIGRTLTYLEERLDPEVFFRVSRKYIVNLGKIAEIHPAIDGGYDLKLESGQEVSMSRRRAQGFRERLSL